MTDLIVLGSIVSALPFRTGSFGPDFFCIGYQIKVFYSMIIFVGAVKIIDGEDESWKTRIIHSKMFYYFFLIQICYTEAILIKNIRILLIIIASVWKTGRQPP